MTFEIRYSVEDEIRGLKMQLDLMDKGWFLPQGFYILPDNKGNPNLPVCIIPTQNKVSLRKKLKNRTLPIPRAAEVNEMMKRINPAFFPESFQKTWNGVHFLIHPTRFGTYGYWVYDVRPQLIHLYIRRDQSLSVLIEIAISSIQRRLLKDNFSWREMEAIGDYFTMIFNGKHEGTLSRIAVCDPQLLKESIDYLHKLKAPVGQLLYEDNNLICFRDKVINQRLSSSERLYISCLIKNYPNVVSYDQLADCVYGQNADRKFSLWGLRKITQRVRNKLKIIGLPGNIVQNVSSQGYLLA